MAEKTALIQPMPSNHLHGVISVKKKKKARKKKPLGVKSFFGTTKNFQGYDLHHCRYEPRIGDHVFVPKNYGKLSEGAVWRNLAFCECCKLKPCVTVEHMEDIRSKAIDEHWARKEREEGGQKTIADLAVIQRIEKFILKLMTKHFGREHMKGAGTPSCVIIETQAFTPTWFESI